MNVAVLSHKMPRKTGIGRFQSEVVPELLQHEEVDPFFFQPREWYPLSMTLETMWHNFRKKEKLGEYDRVFIPAQDRLTFHPDEIDAEVIPYIHDIIHGTSTFQKNGYNGLKSMIGFYISTLQAVRYTKYNSDCDTVIVGSENVKRDLVQRTGFDGDVEVVYQGVELPEPSGSEVGPYDLIYIGTTIERKNPEFLSKTLEMAVERGYRVATVNGEEEDLPGDTFTGISDQELADLYDNSRYYLHASWNEGFGRGPVEAQQFGTVPLALDLPVNKEILGEKNKAWLAVQSPEDAVEQLKYPPLKELQRQAKRNASKYEWSDTVEQVKQVVLD